MGLSSMKPQPIGVCVILLDKSQEKVLLGKRKNSYKSGFYGLPGGRIEIGEKTVEAAKREVKEETGLDIKQIDFVSTIRERQDTYDFIHFVFKASQYTGKPITKEPDKCEGWEWHSFANLPENILNGHKLAIESYLNHTSFIDSNDMHTSNEDRDPDYSQNYDRQEKD